MADMLLKHIPKEYQYLALEQLKGVREHGTEHGKQVVTFDQLITIYDEFINMLRVKNFRVADTYWRSDVRLSQKNLPMFGLQRLCAPERFDILTPESFVEPPVRYCFFRRDPVPMFFDSATLSSTCALFRSETGVFEQESCRDSHAIVTARWVIRAFRRMYSMSTLALDNRILPPEVKLNERGFSDIEGAAKKNP